MRSGPAHHKPGLPYRELVPPGIESAIHPTSFFARMPALPTPSRGGPNRPQAKLPTHVRAAERSAVDQHALKALPEASERPRAARRFPIPESDSRLRAAPLWNVGTAPVGRALSL